MENGKSKNDIKDLSKINVKDIKFCKSHNIVYYDKAKEKEEEQQDDIHIYCEICPISNIEEEKRNKLKENITSMELLKFNVQGNIDKFNKILDIINENKESLKIKIQKIFTKLRSTLNDREEELLSEVDTTYDDLFFNEDLIKECEKLSTKIKKSIEKGKSIDNDWNNKKLDLIINDCLNIENNVKEINITNENLNKFKEKKIENAELKFIPSENDINYIVNDILKFGKISYNRYAFKKCPINISQDRQYLVSGEKDNIITKVGTDSCWMGNICEKQLDKSKDEYKWKIKILRTYNNNIMVGIASIDFDINSSSYEINKNRGWYYNCINGTLYSGPPQYYRGKSINLKLINNEITVIMNMKAGTLKFLNGKDDRGDSYTDIPLDKPIFPSILLKDIYDSVEIIEC